MHSVVLAIQPMPYVFFPSPSPSSRTESLQPGSRSNIHHHHHPLWWFHVTCHIFGPNMRVSENSGTPKSSILIGFSIINHPFWGIPIFGNTHICKGSTFTSSSIELLAHDFGTWRFTIFSWSWARSRLLRRGPKNKWRNGMYVRCVYSYDLQY